MREANIAGVLATGTEEQKQAYLSSFVLAYQKTLTADLRSDQAKEEMTELAFTQVLRTKGRILDAAAGANGAVFGGANAEARASFQRLANARARDSRRQRQRGICSCGATGHDR